MVQFSYSVVFVSDMDRSLAFYRDVLGLPVRSESPKWTEFDTPGVTLALHLADGPARIAAQTETALAGQCQLGVCVEDIGAFHKEMIAKGVTCLQPPKEEDFGGKLALYADPDGLPFSVMENPHTIKIGGVVIVPSTMEVFVDGQLLPIRAVDFKLLHFLASHAGQAFTRQQIVEGVEGPDYPVTDRAVDVRILELRKRLGTLGKLVETVRNVGYRFRK